MLLLPVFERAPSFFRTKKDFFVKLRMRALLGKQSFKNERTVLSMSAHAKFLRAPQECIQSSVHVLFNHPGKPHRP